jgi:hypothetical protein
MVGVALNLDRPFAFRLTCPFKREPFQRKAGVKPTGPFRIDPPLFQSINHVFCFSIKNIPTPDSIRSPSANAILLIQHLHCFSLSGVTCRWEISS